MSVQRCGAVLGSGLLLVLAGAAVAQPLDPYDSSPDLSGPTATPVDSVNDGIAEALVDRAEVLFGEGNVAAAQQLAREALTKSPSDGELVLRAQAIVDAGKPPIIATPGELGQPIDPTDDDAPTGEPLRTPPPGPENGAKALAVYGALTGGMIGMFAGGQDGSDAGAVGLVLGTAIGAGLGWLAGRKLPDTKDARLLGSAAMWMTLGGALIADVADTDSTLAKDLALGSMIGAGTGILVGGVMLNQGYSTGDVAVMDSMAAMGGIAGLSMGLALDPAQPEAYSLQLALGTVGGFFVGAVVGPRVDATPGRMATIDAYAMIGAASPWLLFPIHGDLQVAGLLSTGGLLIGAYLGVRKSRGGRANHTPAATGSQALLRRRSDGGWQAGVSLPRPLANADGTRGGTMLDLAAGTF